MDIAAKYLEAVQAKTGCSTIQGSILDEAVIAEREGTFDYCAFLSGISRPGGPLVAGRA